MRALFAPACKHRQVCGSRGTVLPRRKRCSPRCNYNERVRSGGVGGKREDCKRLDGLTLLRDRSITAASGDSTAVKDDLGLAARMAGAVAACVHGFESELRPLDPNHDILEAVALLPSHLAKRLFHCLILCVRRVGIVVASPL
eukprot:5093860-Prymnesium_polylepis.1